MTGCVCSASVHLTRIFTRKCATTVSPFTTISIHNYFSTGKSCISMRSTNYKFSCRIYMISNLIIKEMCILWIFGLNSWYEYLNDVTLYLCQHFALSIKIIVLGRYYNCFNTGWFVVIRIFKGDLRLSIRTKVFYFIIFSSDVGQFYENGMSNIQCQWHIIFSFIGSVAKHHALISGSLIFFNFSFNTLIYISRLFMNSRQNTA